MVTKELDILEFAGALFRERDPQPNSVEFAFENVNVDGERPEFTLFKNLAVVMCHGISTLFGTTSSGKVDLRFVTPNQIDTINKYMNAIGWNVNLHKLSPSRFTITMTNLKTNETLPDTINISV